MEYRSGGLLFTSKFDSGNLAKVEKVSKEEDDESGNYMTGCELKPDYEYNVWTKPDCAGTHYENGNRSWFYFGVRGGAPGRLLKINIMNMNRQGKLYSQGHAPLVKTVPGKPKWERIRDRPSFEAVDNNFILTFTHRFADFKCSTTYFAFCFPWSYSECQDHLTSLDLKFKDPGDRTSILDMPPEKIYYHRELLCYSLQKLRVDLITISDHHNILEEDEPRYGEKLFPDSMASRCKKFEGKRVYVLTSRVHPGESPGSHVFNGFLDFILREDDLRAKQLRKQFVFKLIPLLNPDGVMLGHYRTDTRGVNLNRMYLDPDYKLYPSIYGAKNVLVYHHVHNKVVKKVQNVVDDSNVNPGEKNDNLPVGTSWELSQENETEQLPNRNKTFNVVYDEFTKHVEHDQLFSSSQNFLSHSNQSCHPKDIHLKPLEFVPAIKQTQDECATFEFQNNIEKSIQDVSDELHRLDTCDKLDATESTCVSQQTVASNNNSSMNDAQFVKADDNDEENDASTEHLGNEGSEGEDDDDAVISGNPKTSHLNDPKLLEISPHESGVAFYVDLHGHASKRGCFIYGNNLDEEEKMVDCMLYPKLVSMNTAHFDFQGCNFSVRNMYAKDKRDGMSKEGSGRVSIYKALGIIHSYTLECNYNTGRMVNSVPHAYGDSGRATPPPLAGFPPKYSIAHYEDVGKALAVAALDMNDTNPWSRITLSEYNSLHTVKEWVRRYLRSMRGGGRMMRNLTSIKQINTRSSIQGNSNSNASRTSSQRLGSLSDSTSNNAVGNRGNYRKPTSVPAPANKTKDLKPVRELPQNNAKQAVQQKPRRRMTIPGCCPAANKFASSTSMTSSNTSVSSGQKSKTPPPVPLSIAHLPNHSSGIAGMPVKYGFVEKGTNPMYPPFGLSRSDSLTRSDVKQLLGMPTASGTDLTALQENPSYKINRLQKPQLGIHDKRDESQLYNHGWMSTLAEEKNSPRDFTTSNSNHTKEEEKVQQLKNMSFLKSRQRTLVQPTAKPFDPPKKPELKMAAVRLHVEEIGSDPPKRKSNKLITTRRRSSSHSPKSAKGSRITKSSGTDSDAEKKKVNRRRRFLKKIKKETVSDLEEVTIAGDMKETLEGASVSLSPRRSIAATTDHELQALHSINFCRESPQAISTEVIDLQGQNVCKLSGNKTPGFWVSW